MQILSPVNERKDVPFEDIKKFAAATYKGKPEEIEIIGVEDGLGIHRHDKDCMVCMSQIPCTKYLDDSDWIVRVSYICRWTWCEAIGDHRHHAEYGVLNGKFSLWND